MTCMHATTPGCMPLSNTHGRLQILCVHGARLFLFHLRARHPAAAGEAQPCEGPAPHSNIQTSASECVVCVGNWGPDRVSSKHHKSHHTHVCKAPACSGVKGHTTACAAAKPRKPARRGHVRMPHAASSSAPPAKEQQQQHQQWQGRQAAVLHLRDAAPLRWERGPKGGGGILDGQVTQCRRSSPGRRQRACGRPSTEAGNHTEPHELNARQLQLQVG